MKSTMQNTPLSVARLLTHGSTVHGASRVATWDGDGVVEASYSDVGRRAAALAHALRSLGVTGDHRVATFMFNNQTHLEAYLAVPSMGAVLHTLNIRLFPDQLTYIVNHADDQVVIVDAAVMPLFARIAPSLTSVRHVVVNGPVDPDALSDADVTVHSYQELVAKHPTEFEWPDVDENDAAALCYTSGTTGNPKGVAYSHRSIWLHSMEICMHEGFGLSDADLVLAVVPQFHAMAWGLPYAAMMSGASLLMPDRFLQADPLLQMIATAAAHLRRGGADDLERPAASPGRPRRRCVVPPRGRRRWFSRAAVVDARLLRPLRPADHPRLGDDRDVTTWLGRPTAAHGE